jgi:hypothetical protein
MIPNRKNNHAEYAVTLLTSMFRGQPNIEAILKVFIERLQGLEASTWDVINGRLLGTVSTVTPTYDEGEDYVPDTEGAEETTISLDAEGVQLDVIGSIVDQGRLGYSDADYARLIKIKIAALASEGKAEDILQLLNGLAGLGGTYTYEEVYPAGFEVYRDDPHDFSLELMRVFLKAVKPAGVQAYYFYAEETSMDDTGFAFGYEDDDEDSARGFSYGDNGTGGGHLYGVMEV